MNKANAWSPDRRAFMTRGRMLGLIGSALLLPGCATNANAVRVGSTDSAQNATIAEIYAIALERQHVPVERHMNAGDEQRLRLALQRGDIDLYPGHITQKRKPVQTQSGVAVLDPSPASDSACLVTSQYAAEKFWLLTVSECARIATKLRLAASTGFLSSDGLVRLRRLYGGMAFEKVIPCEPGTQTYLVARGDADVADSDRTDPNIQEERLVILDDDRHYWTPLHIAPIARAATLHRHPRVRAVINGVSRALTQVAVQQMNLRRRLLDLEPRDVAEDFVRRHEAEFMASVRTSRT